jgi:hypothetical protein
MIPIYLHGREGHRGYMFSDFSQNLMKICEEHQADNRACAFALIVYDMRKPWVNRVLDDPEFFIALDRVSGDTLSVFSIFDGLLRGHQWNHDEALRTADDIETRSQEMLDRYFGLSALRSPAVLFFQVLESKVDRYVSFELSAKSKDEAFDELRQILDACAKSMRDSVGKAVRDPNLAFDRLQKEIVQRKARRTIASVLRRATSIKEIVGLFGL